MPDREKVTGHLNDCLSASRSDNSWVFVRKDIVSDALALLKEPEPHLMTVTDLEALPAGAVVWEEYFDTEWEITSVEPAMKLLNVNALLCESGYTKIVDGMGDPDPDGNAWRWWSAMPSDEQRKAVKWT